MEKTEDGAAEREERKGGNIRWKERGASYVSYGIR